MSKYTILFRIAVIIFVVEVITTIGYNLIEPIDSQLIASIVDASLTTIFTAPPIYYFVIKPYMEERVNILLGVQSMFSENDGAKPDAT